MLDGCHVVYQVNPLGTGDAVKAAVEALGQFDGTVLITFGRTLLLERNFQENYGRPYIEDPPDLWYLVLKRQHLTRMVGYYKFSG
ncbi:MAG: hypothetical protein CM15mP62_06560 [Rhodospirillaceae bacterium]|nr:MAG: hypothetical protein CM15mP62_06560 [Rhodospirillaceae bacterium]